jgi:dTDP-4-amino-4,6-dideoxygalactose transaminase
MAKNGEQVTAFEAALADYCGSRFAIAAANGTVTLQAALVALGVKPGDRVAVPPLTHAATTIAVLNVGAVPVFVDVDPDTWLMGSAKHTDAQCDLIVSLYGLHAPVYRECDVIDDAAQTLRKHSGAAFTSLSFQASKILSLGEGGALLTDDEGLAAKARSYLSLGYQMGPTQARIDSNALKSPTFDRHHSYPCVNGRMNDLTAAAGLQSLKVRNSEHGGTWSGANDAKAIRRESALYYLNAIVGCEWLRAQHVPEGFTHDYWAFAVAADTPERALALADRIGSMQSIDRQGYERPYFAWRVTYAEPAFQHQAPMGTCPIAEDLQPRILAFQTNSLSSAERNAKALKKAIEELSHV